MLFFPYVFHESKKRIKVVKRADIQPIIVNASIIIIRLSR